MSPVPGNPSGQVTFKGYFVFYFKFNIGDYASHTQHLTLIEDMAYRRCLEAYYLSERPLNTGITSVARQIRMREYEVEVSAVLHEFFALTDGGWQHSRIDKEIAEYHSKIEQASRAGKASVKSRFNGRSTDVQPTTNHKPLTTNHKPLTTNQEPVTKNQEPVGTERKHARRVAKSGAEAPPPEGVFPQTWEDFLILRKAKRSPVTATAIQQIEREAVKAGLTLNDALETCCQRGWAGFKADWMRPDRANGHVNKQEALEESNRRVAEEWLAKQENQDASV